MKNYNQKELGFTLLELMTVIALISLIMAIVVPLGRGWVDSTHVNSAVSSLKHATMLAKSSALRNSDNHPMGTVAVSVCFDKDSSTLQVVKSNDCDLGGQLLQDYPIATGVSIKASDGIDFSCLAYDSAGILLALPGCSTNTQGFNIAKNDDEVTIDVI